MKTLTLLMWALISPLLYSHSSRTLAETLCEAREVQVKSNFIQIEPTGLDDTANIQCALDLAVESDIPEIRLTRGDFYISSLSRQNFRGTLQGRGTEHTRLNILHRSIDCAAIEARGEYPAAVKFAGGEPRVRWLTLVVADDVLPCFTGGAGGIGLKAMILFTGQTGSPSDCLANVIYGTVDHVNLEGPRIYSVVGQPIDTAILVSPEESGNPDCRNSLLGSIRINWALVDGFPTGAGINMRGGAQVSVLNTDFSGNHLGLDINDSNAVVTVFGNRFASKAPGSFACCEGGGSGLVIRNHAAATGATRLSISSNMFDVSSGAFDAAWGIRLTESPDATAVRCLISENRFQLSQGGDYLAAISSWGVSGAIVSANLISTDMRNGEVFLDLDSAILGHSDHWTIVSNTGLADMNVENPNAANIYLGANSGHVLIGPGQAAIVLDEGVDNIVLPQ